LGHFDAVVRNVMVVILDITLLSSGYAVLALGPDAETAEEDCEDDENAAKTDNRTDNNTGDSAVTETTAAAVVVIRSRRDD